MKQVSRFCNTHFDLSDIDSYYPYKEYYKMSKIKKDCIDIINWFMDEKGSIRQCSENLMIPKSTIHRYIHTYIKYNWYDLYIEIKHILKFNSEYRSCARNCWKSKP